MMQNWLQGHLHPQAREGEQRQSKCCTSRENQKESRVQELEGEQFWIEENDRRGRKVQECGRKQAAVKNEEAESLGTNQNQAKEQKLEVIKEVKQISNLKTKMYDKEVTMKLTVWLVTLLILARARGTEIRENKQEEKLKRSTLEDRFRLQCSCWEVTDAGLMERPRTGIG